MSSDIQINLFNQNNPLTATVVENKRLTPQSRGDHHDVRHVTFRYKEKFPYVPGQSVGVLSPGIDPRTQKPNKIRLYSISSARTGDFNDSQTVSVCVIRHFWSDEKTGQKDIPGVGSHYVCNLKTGEEVKLTGPFGKHFITPPDFQNRDLIFVATGTGIAPYRGMLQEIYQAPFKGNVWLYFGVPYGDTALYDDAFQAFTRNPSFHYVKAISREEENPYSNVIPTRSNKMYVQVRLYENRVSLKESLSRRNGLIYLCGLKGMEEGIFPVLEMIGKDVNHEGSFVEFLKKEKRLLVEVY